MQRVWLCSGQQCEECDFLAVENIGLGPNMRIGLQDFLSGGGGGGWRHSQAHKPPPPLDIARVTSSVPKKLTSTTPLDIARMMSFALRTIDKPHPPPLDIARVTSSTFQAVADLGGGGGPPPPRSAWQFHFIIGSHPHHMLHHMLDLDGWAPHPLRSPHPGSATAKGAGGGGGSAPVKHTLHRFSHRHMVFRIRSRFTNKAKSTWRLLSLSLSLFLLCLFSPQEGGLIIWPPSVRPYVRTYVRPSVDSDFSEVYGSTGLKL